MTKAKRVCPIKGSGGGSAEGAVSYAEEQSLTKIQKDRARGNIGAASEEELSGKANNDGYYSKMSVGAAENLVGGNDTSREFAEDTAGGTADIADGIVKVERIKGNSIVWRNLIPRMRVVDGAVENWTFSSIGTGGVVVTETSDEISFTNAAQLQPTASYRGTTIIGRKYYWIARAKSSNANNYVFCAPLKGGVTNKYGVADEWVTISEFGVAIRDWVSSSIRFHQNSSTDTTTIDKRIGMVLIDVSSIEESTGKEFQTKSDFESWLAHSGFENYFGYSAGEIFNLNPTAIKTVGFNAYNHATGKAYVIGGNQYQITGAYTSITEDGVTITPDSNGKFTPTKNGELVIADGDSTTTCVHLVWSGKRDGEYEEHWEETRNIPVAQINTDGTITESATGKTRLFPDGLCSVGDVYDEVIPTKAIKRIGKQTITGAIGDEITLSGCKLSATEYKSVSDYGTLANGVLTLTAAVTDKDVLYELETPVEVTFAEPLNLTYRVSDFGTETVLPVNTSIPVTTPIRIDAVYGLNAVDFVRNADKKFITIEDGTGDNGSSFTNLRSALSSSFGIDIVPAFDSENKRYTFTVTDNRNVEVPESATASGTKGTWAEDETAVYFCIDTDTWIKINKETW